MSEFGNIKKIPVKDIWQHEAYNFTPWLAKNLEKLGESVGMDLEITEEEASVGDFSLDILAKDLSTGHIVVIENQFGYTDHDHLGKLLTYAAGFDASIVIWISENVRDEHRQTIEWLNQRTDIDTLFFAIEIEVLKIDDSKPAYNFKPVVFPNEWRKSKRQGSNEGLSKKSESYRSYFQVLIDELRTKHSFTKAKIAQPQNWYVFPTGISGISYGTSFAQGEKVRVELYLDLKEKEDNKKLFDWLSDKKQQINNEFGESLSWERMDHRIASRVAIYRKGSIENTESLTEIQEWAIQELLKFRKVFSSYLKTYKSQIDI